MVRNLRYCQDPIKKHKRKIIKHLRKVTDNLAEKCEGRMKKDSLLCVNCWEILMKNPTIITTSTKATQKQSSQLGQSSEDVGKESGFLIRDQPSTSIGPVLALLDQTPVKKSKY